MAKLRLIAALTLVAGSVMFATLMPTADAADPCKHKDFKTVMVKEACTKGGQKAAKDAMKAFMKEKKIKSCNLCHDKLAPGYSLKPDAYDQFEKNGGKLIGK